MRLTSDLLLRCQSSINAAKDREIVIRGYKIAIIENISVLQDQFDTIDLTDNEIKKIDNFPIMNRLSTLLLSNNFITKISSDIGNHLKGLKALVLTNNRIVNLADVGCLSGLVKLEHLSLLDNPVTLKDKYRLYVIYRIPSLKSLDFQKISKTERAEANEYFASSAGQAMVSAIEADSKTDNKDKPKPSLVLTEDQKMQVRQAIESASTKEEIDAIEKQLKAGTFVFK